MLLLTHMLRLLEDRAPVGLVVCILDPNYPIDFILPYFPPDLNLQICLCPLIYLAVHSGVSPVDTQLCLSASSFCFFFFVGPDHEAESNPKCWAHCQSN